jgi:ubiquinone biosynthesis UbiH/UbiF/VisC/COQ6 family hydroxylase
MTSQFDVIVVGGGLVGASLALALEKQGREVALIEGRPGGAPDLDEGWDARIYAVSPANRAFLEEMGVWPDMARIGKVTRMDVRGDRGGRLEFDAGEIGAPALAWIAENRWMLASIWREIRQRSITVFAGCAVQALTTTALDASIVLSDGRRLGASLVVGGDGADSSVRRQIGVDASVKSYGQSGVVANFACERPHGGCARQWFLGDGVLAWLPLPGNRISMVWSTSDPARLLALDPDALAKTVAQAGGFSLGALHVLTSAQAFPLRLIRPAAMVSQRVALIGDAAHTVHPLAGQGVNLGFQDAAVLAALLNNTRDPGDWQGLRRYQRQRREAVYTMQHACDALFSLFHQQHQPGLARLRNAGLTLVNRLGPLKRQFARHAIGF